MKITLDILRKLINEEVQRRNLQEKQDERKGIPDVDDEKKLSIAQALDVLENAAEDAEDTAETRWYLTKIGETFGLEPEET
jgi:uncharacterized protein (UPF0147 family)